jgi:hypothetical protein
VRSYDEKVIALSKSKVLMLIAGSLVFVAIGLWMFQKDAAEISADRIFNNPLFVHAAGIAGVIFFGLTGAFGIWKLFDTKPGFVLSAAGLVDNSSGVAAGFIPWSEVTGFSVFTVVNQQTLIVKVRNPERYIEAGNPLKRALNRANFKLCGSPIAITSTTLTIGFAELLDSCNQYHAKYGKSA